MCLLMFNNNNNNVKLFTEIEQIGLGLKNTNFMRILVKFSKDLALCMTHILNGW